MAKKRMFDKSVVCTDSFLEMPMSTQVLYFHLSMNADDDGFVDNWKSVMRMCGTKEDDMKLLIAKQFVIPFDSGVIVIRHWRINNYLQNDRKKDTIYKEELGSLTVDDSNVYNLYTDCIHSIDKNSIDNIRKENIKRKEETETSGIAKKIIEYLNKKTNSTYKYSTKSTTTKINARLNEGFKLDDFIVVIDKKCADWLNTDMEKYLRPETLFGTKFESYLNQKSKQTNQSNQTFSTDGKVFFN